VDLIINLGDITDMAQLAAALKLASAYLTSLATAIEGIPLPVPTDPNAPKVSRKRS
jgi:hypothetical protein